jgi:transposase InsO family protein
MHPYELYLSLNELEHRQTRARHPYTNGFVERLHRTGLDEFFRSAFRTKFYESVEAWQTDLATWLDYYNRERTHQGYRNVGRRPFDTVDLYLDCVRKNP